MSVAPTFASLKGRYAAHWQGMVIPTKYEATLHNIASKILKNKARYQAVEAKLGIPWYVVGCLHYRESDCDFRTHLHNGDPLTHRTRQVPAGRPASGSPPFTWEFSAEDALTMRGLQHIHDWSIERIAYEDEAYNGWGYELKGRDSPYDWSMSEFHGHETIGKYVADHVFDPNKKDPQAGCMPILKVLMGLDPTIRPTLEGTKPAKDSMPPKAPEKPQEQPSAAQSLPPPPATKTEPTPAAPSPHRHSPWDFLKDLEQWFLRLKHRS